MTVELQEGEYALQQETSRKVLMQLKLTDSALRAIEALQHNLDNGQRLKPSLRFNGSQGIIQIPTRDGEGSQTFTFQMSTLPPSSSIDCLQQLPSRSSTGRVSAIGEIQRKITVHANDDTYNATRKRMERVKELEKNVSTKVIKQPSNSKLSGKKKLFGRPVHGSNPIRTSPVKNNLSFPRSASPLPFSAPAHPASAADAIGVRNKTKPILSSLSSSSTSPTTTTGKPLQETIAHYLAIRPMKMPDLVTRLSRGLRHIDKDKVKSVLSRVATLNELSEFNLHRSYFTSIQPDWPGYSDDEKCIVKRDMEILRAGGSRKRPSASPGPLPKHSPTNPVQVPLQEDSYSNPIRKKARVSLYKKSPNHFRPQSISPYRKDHLLTTSNLSPPDLLSSSSSVVHFDSANNVVSTINHRPNERSPKSRGPPTPVHRTSPSKNPRLIAKEFSPPANTVPYQRANALPQATGLFEIDDEDPEEALESPRNETSNLYDVTIIPSPEDSSPRLTFDNEDFIRKYQSINYTDERKTYKKDFYAEYKEYLELHGELASQSRRFARWESEMEKEDLYTERYKRMARHVHEEYCRLMQGGVYARRRKRFAFLYRKLKHIKSKILEYDCKRFGSKPSKDKPFLHA